MQTKKKICKGNYRSKKGFGCGEAKYLYKYGLCLSCFRKWLIETESGQKHLKKQVIPQAKKEVKRKEKNVIKEMKLSLKTHKDYLSDLQKVFNKYIRLRDQNKPCISCGKPLTGKFDAGHLFSVGAYPNIRFNEDNVNGQCVACNQHRHGNVNEYMVNLPKRIGQERFNKLLQDRNTNLKISIPEIKEMMIYYKQKIVSLQK